MEGKMHDASNPMDTTSKSFWTSPKQILGTTDAKNIGKLYFLLTMINLIVAGLFALIMRLELWTFEGGNVLTKGSYNEYFTLHGTVMFFLVITPMAAGFGNYLIPRMVAADNNDMYWPKWNNFAFWLLPVASLLIIFSHAPIGWTGYVPLSLGAPGVDAWILGLILVGISSTIGSLNFILTIWQGRGPHVSWRDLDLFVWGILFFSLLLLLATPTLIIGFVMVLVDRNWSGAFYDASVGNPIIYQHLFWFFSHPEVYILVLPAFGLVSHILAKFSRQEIFGYTSMVLAMAAISILSFSVWAHHMYVTGIDPFVRVYFTTMTFIIAIPSGIKVFNWITTLYGGSLKLEVPMLFSLTFIIMFTLGGITGVYVNIIPLDLVLHDTYWVVGHFHFIVAAGTLQVFFATFYYYWPELTGRMYHKTAAMIHFILWNIGNLITFIGFSLLGYEGMPRRYWSYPVEFEFLHQMATTGAMLMGAGFLFFGYSLLHGWLRGPEVDLDNIFDLGEGYDYPQSYEDYIRENEGKELHVDHNLSWEAPVGAIAITIPFLAILAFLGQGPFASRLNVAGTVQTIPDPSPGLALILFAVFVLVVGILFYFISGHATKEEPTFLDKRREEKRHWEMWLFLSSEIIFFGTLIGTGIAGRLNNPIQFIDAQKELDPILTSLNTFVLITSSFTMAKALDSIKHGNQKKLKQYLMYTIILGTIFLSVQIYEYIELFAHDTIALSDTAEFPFYSSTFYLQTGFHGAHVLAGIIFLIFILIRAQRGGYTKENHENVKMVGLYWHFVDLVWVILFTVIYLM